MSQVSSSDWSTGILLGVTAAVVVMTAVAYVDTAAVQSAVQAASAAL